MAAKTVQGLLEDIRLLSEEHHAVVVAARALVHQTLGAVDEELKYGGLLFSAGGVQLGGVFAYKQHVSFEFSHGAAIADPHGHLEGAGKGRRHLKLRGLQDLRDKQLAAYLVLALRAAEAAA
ncbi:DUF1801 domain-containing protein [Pelomonas sp. CA6]|uniref:DUF1801 domain-containing protein n=1 Tax=Pelomonas sp. CA6 TaxID=2907999 RepID=UPI001F4BFCF6|nr:DUF1801 domain-containing protein [Pelomonas sp. CA6]MCH7343364.1 DUF1801 domain-containing protein [Pelomonas sp. CA6]